MAKNTKYVSEATTFIRDMLQQQPKLIEKQKLLRKTWWDTNGIDEEEEKSNKTSAIPLHGYAYYDYSSNSWVNK